MTITYAGHQIALAPCGKEHQAKAWQAGLFYEQAMLDHIAAQKYKGWCIDVGASLGNHTLFFSIVCGLRVLSIEPYAPARCYMEARLRENGCAGVTVVAAACGAYPGETAIMPGPPGNIGMAALRPGRGVPVVPMDRLAAAEEMPPAFIKIDVEGGSADVLTGASRLLGGRPDIYIEAIDETERLAIEAILAPLGYRQKAVFNATPTYLYVT